MKRSKMEATAGGIIFWASVLSSLALTGCARDQGLARLNAQQAATIQSLNQEITRLNQELDQLMQSREELVKAKHDLEEQLHQELAQGDMSLSMEARGLVVTVLERVLFDSGKAELKPSAREVLDKVAEVIKKRLDKNMVYVEGHTDNVPIKYSRWKSNWELSTARATEVIHYFIEQRGIPPQNLAATGYGPYHPVASNESEEGRALNRRVELVISPHRLTEAVVAT